MNRYHNKYHNVNHHTTPVSGDPNSAHDPIASASHPFNGDFNLNGDLQVNGNINLHGNLDTFGYSIQQSNASELSAGVIRFATPAEIALGTATTIAVTPRDLESLSVEAFTHAISASAHSDVQMNSPVSGEVLNYDTTEMAWINSTPIGTDVPLATDLQALSTSTTGVAVTPNQLQSIIKRYKPLFINGAVTASGKNLYLGSTVVVSGDSVISGTMVFSTNIQQRYSGTGNGTVLTTYYGLNIFQYNGTSWDLKA
jgi:hypothetical protein